MVYKEIPVELIEANPWQTRKKYNDDALVGLMASASNSLGIRQAPLVRPYGKKYQIAYGHGRVEAWKALGKKTIMCRVEDLTDSAMKKELLIENVNRSNLNEKERFKAIEQFRLDPDVEDDGIRMKLKNEEYGWLAELSRQTGIPEDRLTIIYDVRSMRQQLVKVLSKQDLKKTRFSLIKVTVGLPDKERVKLIEKAQNMGWGVPATLKVKLALKDMTPEVRTLILNEDAQLPQKVILAVSNIKDAETQKKAIDYIQTHQLNEELSMKHIERVLEGEPIIDEVKVVNEVDIALKPVLEVYEKLSGVGISHYAILSKAGRWGDMLDLLDKIKKKIREIEEWGKEHGEAE